MAAFVVADNPTQVKIHNLPMRHRLRQVITDYDGREIVQCADEPSAETI